MAQQRQTGKETGERQARKLPWLEAREVRQKRPSFTSYENGKKRKKEKAKTRATRTSESFLLGRYPVVGDQAFRA